MARSTQHRHRVLLQRLPQCALAVAIAIAVAIDVAIAIAVAIDVAIGAVAVYVGTGFLEARDENGLQAR